MRCDDPVESQCCSSNTRGGRIVTTEIGAACYSDDDMVPRQAILASHNTGGKDFLPLCRECCDDEVPVVKTGKTVNQCLRKEQSVHEKRSNMDKMVSERGRKRRKEG